MPKIKSFIACFKNLFIYLILAIFIECILLFLNIKNDIVINLIISIILFIIIIYINKDFFKDKLIDFKTNLKKYLFVIVKYYIIGVSLMIITNLLINHFTGDISTNESLNRSLIVAYPVLSILIMVLLNPAIEEIVFRASFKNWFKNPYYYSLVTALIFGFFHIMFNLDYIYIIPYASLGFFLGLTYFKTDNIYTSIVMHSFHNLLCIVLLIGGFL